MLMIVLRAVLSGIEDWVGMQTDSLRQRKIRAALNG
jgi:hypothetical protein